MRAKRIFDLVFALLFLLPLLFIMAIVALAIMLDSEGPVFFRQRRVGLDGKEFYLLKFRSMYHNSSDGRHREAIKEYMNGEALNGHGEAQYKLGNDARITRVGQFIRKTSIDELPQFFNVLRGEMSLVGPRPPIPYEVDLYGAHDRLRLCGKPGLTGIWQVYGRSRVSFQEMVEMDITYLQQQSLWQDLKLIVLTIPVMVMGRGGA
jgi:lipopolysaccharide/colanic/teichoic acid biosynthesis glycosyltransferase